MKVLCPHHDDNTPSCHIYADGHYYCYTCRAYGPTEKLGLKDVVPTIDTVVKPDSVEDNIKYIESLPTKQIRGFTLPYNDQGYFLLWPDKSYYKLRLWEGKSRYRAPRGVKKPLFKFPGSVDKLVIVEGEFNALTLVTCLDTDETICSPGPCTDFVRYIKSYLDYPEILIIADRDAAGAVYGKELRDLIATHKKRVSLYVTSKDYNDILTEEGPEQVQEEFQKAKRMAM